MNQKDVERASAWLDQHVELIVTRHCYTDADVSSLAVAFGRVREEALAWDEDDRPLPEDEAIEAASPWHDGPNARHDLHGEAMRLVGAKRSKGSLVDLVNWLLHRVENARAEERGGARGMPTHRIGILRRHRDTPCVHCV